MISLIIGNKGSGKTKKLINLINEALETSKGTVVCIEKGPSLAYNINYRARLIDTDHFNISGFDMFYGLICGVCAGNYDVTDILIDATLRIGSRDYEQLADFLEKVNQISKETETNFVFTVSTDESELPARIFDFCNHIK